MTRFYFTMLSFIGCLSSSMAQGLIQTGGYLVLNNGCHLVIDGTGDYYDTLNGRIHIETGGTLHVPGDWINSSGNSVFTTDQGSVRLTGGAQRISGSTRTGFPSLTTVGTSFKTLYIDAQAGGSYTGSGSLNLTQDLVLNTHRLIINNSATTGITGTGGIISESTTLDPNLGWVQWNVDGQTGFYRIPFKSISGIPVPVVLNVSTPGTSASDSASVDVATYPTNPSPSPNNLPLAPSATNVSEYGRDQSLHAVDRYWILNSNSFQSAPKGTMTVRYLDGELGGSNSIEETSLRAIGFDATANQWSFPGSGIPFYAQNEVRSGNISFQGSWTLVDSLYCPDPQFTWAGNCVFDNINFINASKILRGSIDSFQWDFGSGNGSIEEDPDYSYDQSGMYDVRLVAYADNGCSDTIVKQIPIDDRALADFDVAPENFLGLPVQFTNTSQDATNWMWEFGDGEISGDENPIHIYRLSGTFEVQLIANHSKNCPDTAVKTISIEPITDFYIPNAFSPGDEDELNATFGLSTALPLSEYQLSIYNRWGELIFETTTIEGRWNGKIDDQYVQNGTYMYTLKFRDTSGRAYYRNGTISVLR